MKKLLGIIGLVFGLSVFGHAGTPMETYFLGQAPLSGTTVIGSTASTVGTATLTVTLSTPTSTIGQSGTVINCRNCFTKFVVQMSTVSAFTIKDNNTTAWTVYGAGIGTTGTNTLVLSEDHLGPFCGTAGNQTSLILTPTNGLPANGQSINYEGYTQCGGTSNAGPMQ